MSTPTLLGKVAATPKGMWSAANGYEILDIVTYGGSGYISLQSVPAGIQITNTSYWLKFCSKGDKGDGGEIVSVSASVDDEYGTPSVNVTMGGTSHERSFAFSFANLRGNGISSVEKTDTSGSVDTYTITYDSGETTDFTVTNGSVTSVNGRTGSVTGLAEQDGYYTSLTSGNAEQIISTLSVKDKAPYLFRTSGGSADIGNRENDKLVGGTVVWNQLMQNGNFASAAGWVGNDSVISVADNVCTLVSTAKGGLVHHTAPRVKDHVFLYEADVKLTTVTSDVYICSAGTRISDSASSGSTAWQTLYAMRKTVSDSPASIGVMDYRESGWDAVLIRNFRVYDLTLMLGNAVAEHVIALESSNKGDGFAAVRPFVEHGDASYNAGMLVNVKPSAHETVGFNQWDEEWEAGNFASSTGLPTVDATRIRSKNFIPVFPYTDYYGNVPTSANAFLYDENKDFLGYVNMTNRVFGTGGASYIRFSCGGSVHPITSYGHDICVNLSWSGYRNGEYEPYVRHTYSCPSPELRGVTAFDGENGLYFDGDEYLHDGNVKRRFGTYTFDGTEQFGDPVSVGTRNRFACGASFLTGIKTSGKARTVTEGYAENDDPDADSVHAFVEDGMLYVFSAASDAEELASELESKKMIYELASPVYETAEPFTSPQAVDDFGTERYVDERDVPIPVGHETEYLANLRDKLQRLPDIPAETGYFLVKYSQNASSFVPVSGDLTQDGGYTLSCTVTGGVPVFAWTRVTEEE